MRFFRRHSRAESEGAVGILLVVPVRNLLRRCSCIASLEGSGRWYIPRCKGWSLTALQTSSRQGNRKEVLEASPFPSPSGHGQRLDVPEDVPLKGEPRNRVDKFSLGRLSLAVDPWVSSMRGVTLKALRPVADRDGPGALSGDLNSKKVNHDIP